MPDRRYCDVGSNKCVENEVLQGPAAGRDAIETCNFSPGQHVDLYGLMKWLSDAIKADEAVIDESNR